VGGNVSLYNDGPAGPIYPTPVIGMVGRISDARRAGRIGFVRAGDTVAVVGPFAPSLAASELEKLQGVPLPDGLPEVDINAVRAVQIAVRDAVRAGIFSSVHDIAEGGLAVALAECCLAGALGARIALPGVLLARASNGSGSLARGSAIAAERARAALWTLLFGEAAGGFVVSGSEQRLRSLGERTSTVYIGTSGGASLRIGLDGDQAAEAAADRADLPNADDPSDRLEADACADLRIEASLAELARASDSLQELFS
jgi:phosphoribosylformylglycinamidine synthase